MEVAPPVGQPAETLRIICWNINGVRAILKKLGITLEKLFQKWNAEAKIPEESVDSSIMHVSGYESFWSFSKKKKGYSGVVTYCRLGLALDAQDGFGAHVVFDEEGRTIKTDHGSFVLFNVYFPNAGSTRERLDFKLQFYTAFKKTCDALLAAGRQIVVVGDFNTAHLPLDVADPKLAADEAFFAPERTWMNSFLQQSGFVDVFREAHQNEKGHYTWFEHIGYRNRNEGMRIDYTLVSKGLCTRVLSSAILSKQLGSDHVPLELVLRKPVELSERQRRISGDTFPSDIAVHPLSSHNKLLQAKAKERQQPKILSFFAGSKKPAAASASSSSSPSISVLPSASGPLSETAEEIERKKRLKPNP